MKEGATAPFSLLIVMKSSAYGDGVKQSQKIDEHEACSHIGQGLCKKELQLGHKSSPQLNDCGTLRAISIQDSAARFPAVAICNVRLPTRDQFPVGAVAPETPLSGTGGLLPSGLVTIVKAANASRMGAASMATRKTKQAACFTRLHVEACLMGLLLHSLSFPMR